MERVDRVTLLLQKCVSETNCYFISTKESKNKRGCEVNRTQDKNENHLVSSREGEASGREVEPD